METEIGPLVAAATTQVVTAFVGKQLIAASDVPAALLNIAAAFASAGDPPAPEARGPAVNLRRLVKPDAVICAECGRSGKTLSRHLRHAHALTVEAYKAKWGLPYDQLTVAPSYSARRSELARAIGLGSPANRGARGLRR